MKVRHIKRRFFNAFRVTSEVTKVVAKVVTVTKYEVLRKKDDVLVAVLDTADQADELIMKAKSAKKASLYSKPVQHTA